MRVTLCRRAPGPSPLTEGETVVPAMTVADFLDLPEFDVPGAVALGVALLSSLPTGAPASVRGPAHSLRSIVLDLQAVWADRSALPDIDWCRANARLGNAWMALHGALKTATRLPSPRERSQLGAQLLQTIFPDGLEFLLSSNTERVEETARRLRGIESERAWRAVSLVTGHPEFLEVVKEAHEGCCAAIGDTASPRASRASKLEGQLQRFRDLVSRYVLQLAAWCRRDDGPGEPLLRSALETLGAALRTEPLDPEAPPLTPRARRRAGQAQDNGWPGTITPHTPIPEVA